MRPLQIALMAALMVAALTWFFFTMRRKISVLLKTKPEVRWDRVPERICTTIRVAFAQLKMFKEPASGLMHALIFWGFLVLLIRTISVFGRAFGDGAVMSNWTLFWFCKPCEHLYTYLKDWTELVVLAMILAATLRRLVFKPKRLTLKVSAYLILSLIGGLMVTDFLYDGARFALLSGSNAGVLAEMQASPIGAFVSTFFPKINNGWLAWFIHAMYWAHVVILLYFLNELPLSKHFHVITSIPNVFFAKLDPAGAIRPIKDIENQETFGVAQPSELTWKQVFDGYSCTECGRCTVNCPAHLTGKPLSPKQLIADMRDYVKKHEQDLLAGKDLSTESPTLIDAIQRDVLWSCTTCRSCEENCPVMINHVDKVVDMRRRLVLVDGDYPPAVATALKNLENKSNPWGLASGERAAWAEGLEVPTLAEKGTAEYLFFTGCFASYDDRNKKVAASLVKLFKKAGVDFAILGNEEGCCGDPARRLGNEYLYQMQAQANIEVMKAYGVKKIVTACPHCMNTIQNEYKQFGGEFEVIHHSQLLAQLVKDGKLAVPAGVEKVKVAFHDSCYLGRYNGIYDAPRDVLNALPGVELGEACRSKQNGFCCGAGGGLMFSEEHIGERMNQARVKQLDETKPELLASACPYCLVMLRDGVNELDLGERLKTKDIAELLAARIAD
jgi:Fe-S oxidoreductase